MKKEEKKEIAKKMHKHYKGCGCKSLNSVKKSPEHMEQEGKDEEEKP